MNIWKDNSEKVEKISCPCCGGTGFTIEFFSTDVENGCKTSCNPMETECDFCSGSGYFYKSQDFEKLEKKFQSSRIGKLEKALNIALLYAEPDAIEEIKSIINQKN